MYVKNSNVFFFQFQCCGVDNWNDWSKYNSLFQTAPPVFNSPDHNSNSRPDFNKDPQPVDKRRVPKSCCQAGSKLKECVQDPTSSNGLNPQGCFQMVLNEINKHESIIGSVAIVIAAVMLINAIISIYMATCGYVTYQTETRPKRRHYQQPPY